MRLKIFNCHHLPPQFSCNSEIFQTLVSNLPEPADKAFASDLGGVNIAGDNRYSELRHQYYVWKNLLSDYDYVGFEHYRRPLFIDPLPIDKVAAYPGVMSMRLYLAAFHAAGLRRSGADFAEYLNMRRGLDAEAVAAAKTWLGGYDVIVPKANAENIEVQWKQHHPAPWWDLMVRAVSRSPYFAARTNHVYFTLERCYFANTYTMRSDLMDEYLSFCFECLDYCQSQMALGDRSLGYFSERLFSFWLYQKRVETPTLRVLELPFIFHDPALDPAVA